MDKELKKAEQARLKTYLKKYWVKPLTDSSLVKLASTFQTKKDLHTFSVFSPNNTLLDAFAQRVILSFEQCVFWENIEAYSLVEEYLIGESAIGNHTTSDLLIVDFGLNKTPNKMLIPLLNGLISTRDSSGKYTLVLCHKQDTELVPTPVSISTKTKHGELI